MNRVSASAWRLAMKRVCCVFLVFLLVITLSPCAPARAVEVMGASDANQVQDGVTNSENGESDDADGAAGEGDDDSQESDAGDSISSEEQAGDGGSEEAVVGDGVASDSASDEASENNGQEIVFDESLGQLGDGADDANGADGVDGVDGVDGADADSVDENGDEANESEADGEADSSSGENVGDTALSTQGSEGDDDQASMGLTAGTGEVDAASGDEADKSKNAADKTQKLTFEDDALVATVEAPVGTFPEGTKLEVEEIHPVTEEKADAYGEALSALSEKLREDDKAYSAAKVYDIRLLDADGVEFEPSDQVTVALKYKQPQEMGEKSDPVDIAHIDGGGNLEVMDSDVKTNASGDVKSAEFDATSFSYYIVFGTNEGSDSEPIQYGDYGWLKFATNGKQDTTTNQNDPEANWGHYNTADNLPATNTEEGYHRILQVRLHTLNSDGNETAYDTDYTLNTTNEYFWTWENNVYISDFYVPGYEVVQTKMHTAWSDAGDDVWQDSLVGNYSVRGYRSSDGTSSELNVLDVYMKSVPTPETAMRYIIRYVHADGSVTDGNVRYLTAADSTTGAIDVDKPRAGEVFSGIAVAAGVEAVTANSSAKTVTFTYDSKVNLAKAYVYFEKAPLGNTTTNKGRYDKDDNGKYYNKEKGLYTDKTAEKVDERQFLVNLEAWYVDNAASVGMVLDASGSMAWTAGVPTRYELTPEQVASIDTSKTTWQNPLSLGDVNKLLDITECDNSNNGYNGYKYYVFTQTVASSNPINEYAALGYAYSTPNNHNSGGTGQIDLGSPAKGRADIQHSTGTAGWFFVNSGTDAGHYNAYGAKRYQGLVNTGGPSRFYVRNENGKWYLYCHFSQGSPADASHPGTTEQDSVVYIKRDQMMTKSETLQDSIAQFGSILNGYSPASEMSMVRFSHANFQSNLTLLNWTQDSEKMAAAMDLTPSGAGGPARADGTYQYGITGGTKARFGFNEFNSNLKPYAEADNYKYLILFTDGKDQGTSDAERTTKDWLNQQFPGYTIITMFMRSVGMDEVTDVPASQQFLQGLASGGKGGNPNEKLYYEALSDDPNAVVEQFRQIAQHIVTGLQNYSIRDYIDPRFDVINEAGDVLSVLDSAGNFTNATNPDVDAQGFRGFTTPDGKQAKLGYDKTKKMFYVIWQNQDIQASAIGSDTEDGTVTPWQSQIRLQSKEDFLGGNDILTNGNASTDNLVYKPKTTGEFDSNGRPIAQYDANGLEIPEDGLVEGMTKKSFPYASVNPELLEINLENYEDTIFLGEGITPGNLFDKVSNTSGGTKAINKARTAWGKLSATAKQNFWNNLSEEEKAAHAQGWADMDEDARAAFVADLVTVGTDAYNYAMAAYVDSYKADLSDGKWYVNYLYRLGEHFHGKRSFYKDFINSGVVPETGTRPANFNPETDVFDKYDPAIETLTVEGNKLTITIPYYYLQDSDDPSVYAGLITGGSMNDRVGTLAYSWELEELAENAIIDGTVFSPYDTYVDDATHMNVNKSVQYQLHIDYVPAELTDDAKNGDDGSERTRAMTGLSPGTALIRNVSEYRDSNGNIIYGDDPAFDDEQEVVPGKQSTLDTAGWAVVHAVDGRILVEKKMKTSDLELFDKLGLEGTMTFTLTGKGIGLTTTANQAAEEPEDPENPDNPQDPQDPTVHFVLDEATQARIARDEVVWTATIDLKNAQRTEGEGDDSDYTFITIPDNWATGLPQGEYVLEETCEGAVQQKSITPVQVVFDDELNPDPAKPYNGTASVWAAPGAATVYEATGGDDAGSTGGDGYSIFIGNRIDSVPSVCSYKNSNYKYEQVKGDLYDGLYKQVDLLLSSNKGKAYLNAQLAHLMVENELKTTSINIVKTWFNNEEPPSASLVAKVVGPSGFVAYVPLTKGGGWTAAIDGIALSETDKYTAQEGLGTVDEDGNCSDFVAFGSPQELDGDKYTMLSQEYDDEVPTDVTPAVAPATDGVVANAWPTAGTVTFNNGKVKTTILLKKINAKSGAPLEGAKFILRDADGQAISGRTEQTTTLNAEETEATVTFENLLPSTTYQIEETHAPEGFERLTKNIVVVVDANGVATLDPEPTEGDVTVPQIEPSADVASTGVYELTVPNLHTYMLPAAGGPGVYPFLLVGAFIAAFALSGEDGRRVRRFRCPNRGSKRRTGASMGGGS